MGYLALKEMSSCCSHVIKTQLWRVNKNLHIKYKLRCLKYKRISTFKIIGRYLYSCICICIHLFFHSAFNHHTKDCAKYKEYLRNKVLTSRSLQSMKRQMTKHIKMEWQKSLPPISNTQFSTKYGLCLEFFLFSPSPLLMPQSHSLPSLSVLLKYLLVCLPELAIISVL